MKKILFGIGLFLITMGGYAGTNSITFATEATYPPFEYVDTAGQMQGFDVAIIKALCQQMQTQCTFTNQSFDSLIPSVQLGKFDAIFGAMNITAERQQQVDFTNPYFINSVSIVAPKNNAANLQQSLQGKTIGVQAGTTLVQYLQNKYGSNVKVNTYASEESAFLDLTSGRIDAVMGDTPLVKQWLQKNGNTNYVIVGQPITDQQYFGKGYGIAVKKGNAELLAKLNAAIVAIKKDGAYDKIVQQYFGK